MSNTYQTLYLGEVRQLELIIRNWDETPFSPSGASAIVYDSSGTEIEVCTTSIGVSGNSHIITTTITTNTTSSIGTYEIIWTIRKDNQIYKHKSIITVLEL